MCKPGVCEVDALVGTYTCDGAKECKLGATTVCAPYSCDAAKRECFSACSSDADCVTGRKCVNGLCGPKMNGAVCKADNECASSHCAGGVCCNAACDGACQACNMVGHVGTCMPVAVGLTHPRCAAQAAATCGTTGTCDGFGSCAMYPADTPCGASTCSGATAANSARSCDGLGTCRLSTVASCGTYRCANGKCNSRCTSNADCADGVACVNNNCGPKVDGQACNANADCLNQHCVRDTATGPGICCNTDCTGACQSCALSGTLGRCTPVAAGTVDPRRVCAETAAATCGTDGRCDGMGGCRRYGNGTVCAAESCLNDAYTPPSTCNGGGQCIKPAPTSCAPYRCNANRCFTACTNNTQCLAPAICGMNGMVSSCGLKPLGAACSAASECSSNFCVQGVCCNNACNTACHACNLAGSVGTCANVNSGADPRGLCAVQAQSTCGTTGQCAAGQCARWAAGTQCQPARCMTASVRTPPAACNGSGTCVTPSNTNCAPGRCDATTLTCSTACTGDAQCTAPAVCLNGSCTTGGGGTGGAGTGGAGTGGAGTGGRSGTGGAGTGGARSGGAPGSGGAPSSGGAPGSGGASASGGAPASGGKPGSGGAPASGGTPGSGGAPGSGGHGTGGAMELPRCGALELCIGSPPTCTCPPSMECGLLLCEKKGGGDKP